MKRRDQLAAPSTPSPTAQERREQARLDAIERASREESAAISESFRLAALVSPKYRAFRTDILKAVSSGAGPFQIADLLERCSADFPEIDPLEIADLRSRCDHCWRPERQCDASPCARRRVEIEAGVP